MVKVGFTMVVAVIVAVIMVNFVITGAFSMKLFFIGVSILVIGMIAMFVADEEEKRVHRAW